MGMIIAISMVKSGSEYLSHLEYIAVAKNSYDRKYKTNQIMPLKYLICANWIFGDYKMWKLHENDGQWEGETVEKVCCEGIDVIR